MIAPTALYLFWSIDMGFPQQCSGLIKYIGFPDIEKSDIQYRGIASVWMAEGYLYVLVNSSMPGLVKVGKTTRLPSERVAELSGSTGVATPFIVAFEQYFADCDAAEQYVHTELTRRRLREAANREFFRAAPNDVIRVILETPGLLSGASDDVSKGAAPWQGLFAEAEQFHYGRGEHFQDSDQAERLYLAAARLGAPLAFRRLGDLLHDAESRDNKSAAKHYQDGASRGDYGCYAQLAGLYEADGDLANARKAFELYFARRAAGPNALFDTGISYPSWCAEYIRFCVQRDAAEESRLERFKVESNVTRFEIIREVRFLRMVSSSPEDCDAFRRDGDYRIGCGRAVRWAEENLIEGIKLDGPAPAPERSRRGFAKSTAERPPTSFTPKNSICLTDFSDKVVVASYAAPITLFFWAPWSEESQRAMRGIAAIAPDKLRMAWFSADYTTARALLPDLSIDAIPSAVVVFNGDIVRAPEQLNELIRVCAAPQ
jgi:hypothetical protein